MPRTNPKTPDAFSDRPTTSRRASRPVRAPFAPLSRAALALFVLLAPGAAARAQQVSPPASRSPATAVAAPPAGETIDEDDVLRIDSNLVHIPALVTETTGRSVPDLRLEDFELRIDGQLKPVGELGRAETPVALALLFDNSSSLSKARAFEKQAATRFLTRIVRSIDRASIYSVSTVPALARPLTNSVPVLVGTIEQFPEPEGATALFDAITEAAAYLRPQEGRRVIVVVSDGNDTVSEHSFDQALQRALKSDCQIYVVGTGDIESNTLADTLARRRLQVLAAQTGGALYVPRSVQDLDHAFEQISRDISQQYVLSYFPLDDPSDGSFRVIDLRVKDRPALRVRAREGYYAAMGQARVRPRTIRRAKGAAAKRAALPRAAPVASLDPLYAPPVASAPARGAAAPTSSDVTFRTKQGATARTTSTRRGPQESADAFEPERTVEAERTTAPASQPAPPPAPEARTEIAERMTPAANPASATNDPHAPVSGGVLNGKALRLPPPVYPRAAKTVRAGGSVTVEVEIDEEGRVASAQAVSGHPLLHAAALHAARQARFSPTLLSGSPVRIKGTLVYSFRSDQ